MELTFLDRGRIRFDHVTNDDIFWRNFRGLGQRPGHPNDSQGNAYFNLKLTPDIQEALVDEGWDIEVVPSKSQDAQAEPTLKMQVKVDRTGFANDNGESKSKIWQVSDRNSAGKRTKNLISVDDLDVLGSLDSMIFDSVSLILRPAKHKKGRSVGLKYPYLQSMIFTIAKPDYGSEWADVFDDAPCISDIPGDDEEVPFE